MLDNCPSNCHGSWLKPDIDTAEKRQEKNRYSKDQKALVKFRSKLDHDEEQAHCHEKGARYLKGKTKHGIDL